MPKLVKERELAALARRYRKAAGKSASGAARDLEVSQVSIFHAEESPEESLSKLRIRMIEKYSAHRVVGPVYVLKRK